MYLDANCPQLTGNTNSAYSACQPVLENTSPLHPQDNSIASLLFGSSASVKDAKVATVGSGPEITWEVSGPTGFRATQEFKVQVLFSVLFIYFWPCWVFAAVQGLHAVLVLRVAKHRL